MASYKCPKCDKEFIDKINLTRHLARKYPCDTNRRDCTICNKTFSTASHLCRHMKQFHPAALQSADSDRQTEPSPVSHQIDIELADAAEQAEQVVGESSDGFNVVAGDLVDLLPEAPDIVEDAAADGTEAAVDADNAAVVVTNQSGFFEFGDKKIRKTPETPQRISVYDLIAAITDDTNPRTGLKRLKDTYPEIVASCYNYKFDGRGNHKTPVTDARGAVVIMNMLPGQKAAAFRIANAETIFQQLGGITGEPVEIATDAPDVEVDSAMVEAELQVSATDNAAVVVTNQAGFFEFCDKKIRKTPETPQRVSVYDLIAAITDQDANAARMTYTRLPDVATICADFKFEGRGQRETPVTDARGAVVIMNLLPGRKAAQFRLACADVMVRYLGGDETLIAEIQRNAEVQATVEDTNPLRLFGHAVDAARNVLGVEGGDCVVLQSVTNVIEHTAAQCYFRQVAPTFTNVHPIGRPDLRIPDDQLKFCVVLKQGCQDVGTGRQDHHIPAFRHCSILVDSFPTKSFAHIERKCKQFWANRGMLFEGTFIGKKVRDNELLVFRTQEEYNALVNDVIRFINQLGADGENQVEIEREKTKQADAAVRLKEIEFEILKLQFEMRKFEASQLATPATHVRHALESLDD